MRNHSKYARTREDNKSPVILPPSGDENDSMTIDQFAMLGQKLHQYLTHFIQAHNLMDHPDEFISMLSVELCVTYCMMHSGDSFPKAQTVNELPEKLLEMIVGTSDAFESVLHKIFCPNCSPVMLDIINKHR